MDMTLVADILLVDGIGQDSLLVVLPSQDCVEILLEVPTVSVKISARIFPEQQKLSLMRLRGHVTLESVRVSALFLAHLTIPPQLL